MKNAILSAALTFFASVFILITLPAQSNDLAINLAVSAKTNAPEMNTAAAPANPAGKPALKPDFTAGQQAASFEGFREYITENLTYPQKAQHYNIEGVVRIQIEISAEGKITDINIVQSLGYGCDEAAIQLMKNMPDWKPAMNYGIPVKTKKVLEFSFSL